jgi:hypothetical protein
MGSGMENPDLPPPPIYRRIFHVPKGGGKSGFYCIMPLFTSLLPLIEVKSPLLLQQKAVE